MAKGKTRVLAVRLDPDMAAHCKAWAAARRVSLSSLVRELILADMARGLPEKT